jgi:hypothetical protein
MSHLWLNIRAQYQHYGPRVTWYGVVSGALYTMAVLISALLRTQGLDRQIRPNFHVSDLITDTALVLGAGLLFRLSWSLARTRRIRATLDPCGWALVIAAGIITVTGLILLLVFYTPQVLTGFLPPSTSSKLPALVVVPYGILLYLIAGVIVYVVVVILGFLVCVCGILMSRLFNRATVPAD